MIAGRQQGGTEIAIVGGGIVGLAIAAERAGRGWRTHLLERGCFGGMARVAFAGILGRGTKDDDLADLARLSGNQYRSLAPQLKAVTGIDIERVEADSLQVARTEPESVALRRQLSSTSSGRSGEWLTDRELRVAEPALSPALTGAVRFSGEAHIRPRAAVAAFAETAILAGGSLREQMEVTEIELRGGRVAGVRLADGGLAVDAVVLATGAWSRPWGERLGVSLPVRRLEARSFALSFARPACITWSTRATRTRYPRLTV